MTQELRAPHRGTTPPTRGVSMTHEIVDGSGTDRPDRLTEGVSVLQAVAYAAGPVPLDDLVRTTGQPRGVVAGMVEQLVRGGLVERCTDGADGAAGAVVPGWLLHGLGRDGVDSIEHVELALDEEFAGFVSERLTEEVVAATYRREHTGVGPEDDERAERGLRLLHDLLLDLELGVLPDDVTLQLLTRAYASHPEFQARWSRPSALLRGPAQGT